MNKKYVGLIITIALLLVIIIPVTTIWSNRNTTVALEERIDAQYTTNKSNYDNMWKKFKEMTQVTDLQADNFKKVYDGLISGRYNDSQLLFKMVQESNPTLDQSTYTNLQNNISSSRDAFDNNQKQLADIIREYNTYTRQHFITASVCGFQLKDANKYITTSDTTQKAFDTNKDDQIKLK
jgi:hypothetical protein